MERRQHISLRLPPSTIRRLGKHASRLRMTRTAVAEQYLEEASRMADHAGIVFREEAAGRRPALAGHRLDVWRVVDTVKAEGSIDAAAAHLNVSPALVDAAVGYYAEFTEEVDRWAEAQRQAAAEAEADWRRREAALDR